jgi:hypothetical protein
MMDHFALLVPRRIIPHGIPGGKLLNAMRVISNGAFNLCPSEVCNPEGGGVTLRSPDRRLPIGQALGSHPFERVVHYLAEQIERAGRSRIAISSECLSCPP